MCGDGTAPDGPVRVPRRDGQHLLDADAHHNATDDQDTSPEPDTPSFGAYRIWCGDLTPHGSETTGDIPKPNEYAWP